MNNRTVSVLADALGKGMVAGLGEPPPCTRVQHIGNENPRPERQLCAG